MLFRSLGRVRAEADKPGDVRVEILRLGPKAAIGPGKQKPISDGLIQDGDVSGMCSVSPP